MKFLEPKGWKPTRGYANGVMAEGKVIFVAGQIGWDERQEFLSDNLPDQVRQTLKNIAAILKEGGAQPKHIARMTWYVKDKREYLAASKEIGKAYREVMGEHYPAMSLVQVADLVEDRAKVEIEATAVVR